jgi:hypothetical protein
LEQRKLKNNGEFINVHVSLVSSPQNFIISLQEDVVELNNNILPELQKYCAGSVKLTNANDVKKNECYAIYDDETRKWVR